MFSCIRGEELTFKNLVNGEWVTSNSNKYIEIYSPIGNCLVGKVPAMTKEEVDFAIKNAKETQISWKNVPVNKRAEILYKAADLLIEKSDEMSDIMMREIGKDKKSCESEILRSAIMLDLQQIQLRIYQERVFQEIASQDLRKIRFL